MNLARYEIGSVDDPYMDGLSLSLFISGCKRGCKGCQNPELQSFDYGRQVTTEYIKKLIRDRKGLISSVVYGGGDWMYRPHHYLTIASCAKDIKLRNILYTGFSIMELPPEVIGLTNIIIDGAFEEDLSQNRFPASSNQNVYVDGKELSMDEIRVLPINKHLEKVNNA